MKKQTTQVLVGCAILAALVALAVVFWPDDLKEFTAASIFTWFQNNVSYVLIFVLMAIESSFIPFPSEIVVPPAAYFACSGATSGDLNVYVVVIVATLGALLGATVNYVLSLLIGRPVVYGFANSRIGHMCLIDAAKVEKAEKYFDEHGAVSTFLGRLIPAVRQLISIPAGLARMNFAKFALFTTLGAGIWNAVLAALGWWLSTFVSPNDLFAQIEANNKYLSYAGYALLAIIVIYIAYKGLKKTPKSEKSEDSNV